MASKLLVGIALIVFLINPACAQKSSTKDQPPPFLVNSSDKKLTLPALLPSGTYDPALPVVLVVDKTNHVTHALQMLGPDQSNQLVDVLSIPNATGRYSRSTREGRACVVNKDPDPIYYPTEDVDPSGKPVPPYSRNPNNPLGPRWIGLSFHRIGMHGTDRPESIGHNASHGCIRHRNEDIVVLYDMVSIKTPVYITACFKGTRLYISDLLPPSPPVTPSPKPNTDLPPVEP